MAAVALVCGRKIVQVEGSALRDEAAGYRRVVVDLGAGDGRFAYRLARASPPWFVIAIDANAGGMREISRRAGRKPPRGGAPNVRFVRAAAEALPAALDGVADEIHILYPWGSLLRAVIVPDVTVLRSIARLGKPGASVHVRVNASALGDSELAAGPGRPAHDHQDSRERLASAYKASGLRIDRWTWEPAGTPTSWGKRLSHGSPGRVLAVDARVESFGRQHPHPGFAVLPRTGKACAPVPGKNVTTDMEVYLDAAASGRVMAHVLDPPGFGRRYRSREEMEQRLPGDLREHLEWLASHGEPDVPGAGIAWRIAGEAQVAGDFESGDDVGFYAPDAVAASPDEVERYLRIAGYAHEDLLGLVNGLGDDALDWVRDARTRPIRMILRHVAAAELWYMTRIVDDPAVCGIPEIPGKAYALVDATDDMAQRVRIAWDAFHLWARSLPPDLRGRIAVPTWFTRTPGERWTARKMLRRCIEHCCEHTRNVRQILSDYRDPVNQSGRGGEGGIRTHEGL